MENTTNTINTMNGPMALERLCGLIDPAITLLEDHKTVEAFSESVAVIEKGGPVALQYLKLAKVWAPVVRAHSAEVFTIAATLIGKDYDEVCNQPIPQTIKEMSYAWNSEIGAFFPYSGATGKEK